MAAAEHDGRPHQLELAVIQAPNELRIGHGRVRNDRAALVLILGEIEGHLNEEPIGRFPTGGGSS